MGAVRDELIAYFRSHAGIPVYKTDLMHELQLDGKTVMKSINNLINSTSFPGLKRQGQGGPWIYTGNGESEKPSREIYQLVGETKKGTKIVESEDGTLYKLDEIPF